MGRLNQTVYLLVGFSHVSMVGCGQWGGSASVDGASAHVSGMILQPHLGWFWLQKRCVYRAGWRKEAIVYRRLISQSGADQVRVCTDWRFNRREGQGKKRGIFSVSLTLFQHCSGIPMPFQRLLGYK